jgi:hypothetical protein
MKYYHLFSLIILVSINSLAQSSSDSVTVTFIANEPQSPNIIYCPGEFNNWGNNQNGNIPLGDPSTMIYSSTLSLWTKT